MGCLLLWSHHQLRCYRYTVWFASRCSDRRLSTWQMTVALCPTALGTLCGQLTYWLAWCRKHAAVTATELLQPLDLACGTLPDQQRNPDITYGLFRRQLKGHLFWEAWTRHSVTSDMQCLRKTLTYCGYHNVTEAKKISVSIMPLMVKIWM